MFKNETNGIRWVSVWLERTRNVVLLSFDFSKDEDWKTFAWVNFQPLDFFKGKATVTARLLFMTFPLHIYAPRRTNPEAKTSTLHIK